MHSLKSNDLNLRTKKKKGDSSLMLDVINERISIVCLLVLDGSHDHKI